MADGTPPSGEPHNIEAEQGLLGAVLLNNAVLDACAGLEPEHFYDPVHGRIFKLTRALILKGMLASPVTMKNMMAMDPGLKKLGGPAYLARLAAAVVSIVVAGDYARLIREMAHRRESLKLIDDARLRIIEMEMGSSISSVSEELADGLARVDAETATEGQVHTFASAAAVAAEWTNRAYQRQGVADVTWGVPALDALTGGLQAGRLYMVGARTSMGKTTFALHTAWKNIRRPDGESRGRGVLFASLEMPQAELAHRSASMRLAWTGTRIPYADLASGKVDETTFRTALECWRDLEAEPLDMVEDDCRALPRIRGAIRRARKSFDNRGCDLGAVVIDYLQLVKVPGTTGRAEEVSAAARDLKAIAKEFHVPVVVLAQVKREVEDRKNRRPTLSDIRWAGEAEEAADVVVFLYRHAYYLARDIKGEDDGERRSKLIAEFGRIERDLELIVAKNRGGPLGDTTVWIDLHTNHLATTAPPWSADDGRQSPMEGFE